MTFTSSASQIANYELCPRKWAFDKIDRVPRKANANAQFGINVHAHLERWLRDKTLPPPDEHEGEVAEAMIPHLPPPHHFDPDDIEIKLDLELDGIPFIGYIDAYAPGEVFDHKTTGNLRYALTEETMHEDIQATLYAWWDMHKTGKDTSTLQWTYGTRDKRPKTRIVRRTVYRHEIQERVRQTTKSAHETKLIKLSGKRALDLPFKPSGCHAFGGCQHQSTCNLSPQDRFRAMQEQQDFLAKMSALSNGVNGAEAAPPAAPLNPPEAALVPAAVAVTPKPAEAGEPPRPIPVEAAPAPVKKKRGRPKKVKTEAEAAPPEKMISIPETVPTALVDGALDKAIGIYERGFIAGFKAGRDA